MQNIIFLIIILAKPFEMLTIKSYPLSPSKQRKTARNMMLWRRKKIQYGNMSKSLKDLFFLDQNAFLVTNYGVGEIHQPNGAGAGDTH